MALHKSLPYFYAIAAAALFGSGAPVAKVLLDGTGPVTLAGLLYMGSGLGMAAYLVALRLFGKDRDASEASLCRADLPWIMGVVIFGGFLAPLTLMLSLQATPAATAALLLNFEAVATAGIAALLFAEAVGRRTWAALGLITASCLILSLGEGGSGGFSLAALGILLACTFWGLDNNFSRNVSAKDPLTTVMIKGIGAGALSLLLAHLLAEPFPEPGPALFAMAIGLMSYGGLTSVLFLLSLRRVGSARTGSLLAIAPFFGIVVSFAIFAAPPQGPFYLALPVMAAGAYLLVTERHAHPHDHLSIAHEHRHRHDDLHHDHLHLPGTPLPDRNGEHSHLHAHEAFRHEHSHVPDTHHRHRHE